MLWLKKKYIYIYISLPWMPSKILVDEMTSCWRVILNLCRAEEGGGGDERVPPLLTVLNWVHGNTWIQLISCCLYWGECLKISVIKSEKEKACVVKCVNAGGVRCACVRGLEQRAGCRHEFIPGFPWQRCVCALWAPSQQWASGIRP